MLGRHRQSCRQMIYTISASQHNPQVNALQTEELFDKWIAGVRPENAFEQFGMFLVY